MSSYQCPFCVKTYKVQNSVYAHVKANHPEQKYSNKESVILKHKTSEQVKESKRAHLISLLSMGEIDAHSFELQLKQLDERYLQVKTQVPPVTLDVGKVLSQDLDYLADYFLNHNSFRLIALESAASNYVNVFCMIFKHQIQCKDDLVGWTMRYMANGEIKCCECDVTLLTQMYLHVINGVALAFMKKFLCCSLEGVEDGSDAKFIMLNISEENAPIFNKIQNSVTTDFRSRLPSILESVLSLFPEPIHLKNEAHDDE
jgi:hypothetical protein